MYMNILNGRYNILFYATIADIRHSLKSESAAAEILGVRRYSPPDAAAQFSLKINLKAFCSYRRFEVNAILVEAPPAETKVPHKISNATLQLGRQPGSRIMLQGSFQRELP